jgi:HSP20 family molecular chaperone IbpA
MSRVTVFNSPFLLGFDNLERAVDRLAKASGDGYPPYNIEQTNDASLRITLAVAGFSEDDLSVMVEDRHLVIRGKQADDDDRIYLHRGIAARQFQRAFVLAEGIEVGEAQMDNGLLHVDLVRPDVKSVSRIVEIKTTGPRGLDAKSAKRRPKTIEHGAEEVDE